LGFAVKNKSTNMKGISIALGMIVFNLTMACFAQVKELNNPFYCFGNAMNLPNAPKSFEEQAALVKKIGYKAISGSGVENYFEFRKALDHEGLKLPEIYIELNIDKGIAIGETQLKKIIRDSKDRDLLITLPISSKLYKNNHLEGDAKLVEILTELADYAAVYHVKLAIYPHFSNYCESIDHALKIASMAGRSNIGIVFNLCHFLKVEGKEHIEEAVTRAMPYLMMVSICGADSGDTKNMDWNRLIQPLGSGSFNTYDFVKLVKDKGYNGIFGLQCYNIKVDAQAALFQSLDTWNSFKRRYIAEK
jgi:sugar phosphate isomerase/epimerase